MKNLPGMDSTTELETLVQCRLSGRVRDLRLLLGEKGVILRGRSASYYVKQLAQHAVMESTKIPIQSNEIEVCYPSGGE